MTCRDDRLSQFAVISPFPFRFEVKIETVCFQSCKTLRKKDKKSCNMALAVSKLLNGMHIEQVIIVKEARRMRSRDPHRENVANILAICFPIMTMQHIRKSPSASHATRIYLDIHDFHCGPPEQFLFPPVTVHFL